jgi:hypothetical protein
LLRNWASRYGQSWSLHRLAKTRTYRPGGYVFAPDDRVAEEQARGAAPPVVINIGVWTERLEEIDIFDWQSEVKGMLSVADLELALAASEGYLRGKVQRGELVPDHSFQIGTRTYHYFRKDRQAEIAKQFGLKPVTAANIRERFLAFCEEMDMSASYKPVLLLCLLEHRGRRRLRTHRHTHPRLP